MVWFTCKLDVIKFLAICVTASAMGSPVVQKNRLSSTSESTLTYVLDHPIHTVYGVSDQVRSTVILGDAKGQIEQVEVIAPVSSFDSGNKNRDKKMLKVTDAAQHPAVKFKSTGITGSKELLTVQGQLSFHGVTRTVVFKAKPRYVADKLIVNGELVISLEDFNIKRPSVFGLKVDDALPVKFHMVYPAAETNP